MITEFELSERFKAWAKVLTKVDTTKDNGYAFEGRFIKINRLAEIPDNCVVLTFEETGSVKNRLYAASLYQITDGVREVAHTVSGNDWALRLRAKAADLINAPAPQGLSNPLAEFTTVDLIAELRRRGHA